MGMGFREYLNWCRMLDYTRLKQKQPIISAVKAAEICGFGSLKSFYRAKKMYEGGIPDVWQNQNHKLIR